MKRLTGWCVHWSCFVLMVTSHRSLNVKMIEKLNAVTSILRSNQVRFFQNPDAAKRHILLLTPKGRFYMVHRPFRLPEILAKMSANRIEPKRMRLVHPYVDKEPNLVLVEGLRGGNPRMKVEPPLVVYERDGSYTEEPRRDPKSPEFPHP